MKELQLYTKEMCPFCQKVVRFINKHNIDVTFRDIKKDPEAQEELLRIGGQDMVPMLLVDGEPMYESSDIIRYLKENHTA